MNRTEHLQRLRTEVFDLCIIGGGASGAGCALDAVLRGLKVALIEKEDFAAGTSSRSTKLIHGGVRYLEQAFKNLDFAQLRQVRHGLAERHTLLANAPHLARPLAILTPVFSWWEGMYLRIGLWLYDWFAARKDQLPKSRWLSRAEALQRMPGLSPNIHSAVLYYDGQLDDARYCLAIVQSAAEAGAAVANHLEVLGFQKDARGKLQSVSVKNGLQHEFFEVRARQFLNCTGAYADIVRHLANSGLSSRIRPSKGVHVVLPATVSGSADAMLIPKTKDGRVVFAIPFEGQLLLGTTDSDYPNLKFEPVLEASEIDFLLETLQPFVAQKLRKDQVKAGFGGLRPLVVGHPPQAARGADLEKSKSTKRLLRDHEVEYDPASGLLSLLGGKWTTYRLMARDAVDVAARLLGNSAESTTENHLLVGAADFSADGWKQLVDVYYLDIDIAQHLHQKYGDRASRVGDLVLDEPGLAKRLHRDFPFIQAEVIYAVRYEMVGMPRDFLARRIRLEMMDWEATKTVAPLVSYLIARELPRNGAVMQIYATQYQTLLDRFSNHLF